MTRQSGLRTLGAAAYLDAPDLGTATWFGAESSQQRYWLLCEQLNPVLSSSFSDLYALLRQHVSSRLGIAELNVKYSDYKALPGFHIHEPNPVYALQATHVPHFDRPFAALDWGPEGLDDLTSLDRRRQLSFTLTLQLPSAGGGLRIWSLDRSEALGMATHALKSRLKLENAQVYEYEIGSLLLHTGQELHQISPWSSKKSDLARITLQGHGLEIDGRWILYW